MVKSAESISNCRKGLAILTGMFERMRGLKNPKLRPETTVVLVPCCDVHTVGMSEAIDVAFVDETGVIVGVHRSVSPGRRLRCVRAKLTIERMARLGKWYEVGDSVFVLPASKSFERKAKEEGNEDMSDL